MNPETGFAPDIDHIDVETPEPRHLADILQLSVKTIQAMPVDELQRLHDEMLPHLGRPDKPSLGFDGYIEHLPAPLRKQLEKPGVRERHLRNYLEANLATLRTRVRIDQANEERQDRKDETDARERLEQEFFAAAEVRVEKNFGEWNRQRESVDRHGRPAKLYPEDQAFVEMIDNNRNIERAKLNEFFDLTDRYEVGFAHGLEQYQVFGADAKVTIHPTTKFDDYARGVDMIARISPAENETEIVLGIDFSVASTDIDIAKKLRRNRQNPLRKTKYATREIPQGVDYLPVVLSIDQPRAERMVLHEAMIQTAAERAGGDEAVKRSTADVAFYHDEAVFQYTVIAEAVAQLHVQREALEDRHANEATLATYGRAIEYFERLLADRKNLQAVAGLETKRDEGVYRVANESFIRSAPELVAGAGASRAA